MCQCFDYVYVYDSKLYPFDSANKPFPPVIMHQAIHIPEHSPRLSVRLSVLLPILLISDPISGRLVRSADPMGDIFPAHGLGSVFRLIPCRLSSCLLLIRTRCLLYRCFPVHCIRSPFPRLTPVSFSGSQEEKDTCTIVSYSGSDAGFMTRSPIPVSMVRNLTPAA